MENREKTIYKSQQHGKPIFAFPANLAFKHHSSKNQLKEAMFRGAFYDSYSKTYAHVKFRSRF